MSRDGEISPLVPFAASTLIAAPLFLSPQIHPATGYFLGAGLALALLLFLVRGRAPCFSPLVSAGLLFIFIAAGVSVLAGLYWWDSLRRFLLLAGCFLAAGIMAVFPRDRLRVPAGFLAAGGALSSLFALRQHFGGFERTLASAEATEHALIVLREGRVFGLTFSPDILAAILAAILPLSLSLALSFRDRKGRWRRGPALLCLGAALLYLCALALTRSLGGWLAACAGAGSWLLLRGGLMRPGRAGKWALAALAVLALSGGGLIVAARGGHLFDLSDLNNPLVKRLDNFETGLKVAREFPLTGAGLGQYGLAAFLHRSLQGNEAKHVHNLFLETLAETGPLGLLGILILTGGFLAAIWRKSDAGADPDPAGREIIAGFSAGGIAVLCHSMMDYSFQTVEGAVMFWAALGVVAGQKRDSFNKNKPFLSAAAALLIIAASCFLYQGIIERLGERAREAAREGKWSEAAVSAKKAVRFVGFDDELFVLLARYETIAGQGQPAIDKAIGWLNWAIKVNPRNPFHHRDRGLLLSRIDPARAEAGLRRAVELYPHSLDLNVALARWLRRMKRPDEAAPILEHAMKCAVNNGEALFEAGLLALEKGEIERAERLLEKSAFTHPEYKARALWYGSYLLKNRGPDQALEFYRLWISKKGEDEEVRKALTAIERSAPPPR